MKWLMKFFIVIAFVIGINYFILNDLNEIIVDKNASKIFKEAFKIENLIDHKVILKKEKLFVIINFNDKLKKSEIQSIRTFVMKIFVMKRPGIIGVYPYNNVFENNRYWNEVELNIFVEDRKMITEKFYKIDTNDIKFDYKENSNLKKLID